VQLSEFQASLEDRKRRAKASLSAIEKAGPEAALNRCRALARQIQSDLLNKKPDQFVNALSLADLQVSLERAASVLEQKIQCSSTEKPTFIAQLVCATLRGPGTGVPSSSDCPITPYLRQATPGGM